MVLLSFVPQPNLRWIDGFVGFRSSTQPTFGLMVLLGFVPQPNLRWIDGFVGFRSSTQPTLD
jgi:flavorubredoxin